MAKFDFKDVFYPQFFSVLKKGYTKKQFTKDLFSGVIVGIVALPLSLNLAAKLQKKAPRRALWFSFS